jgi:hypothetical protein
MPFDGNYDDREGGLPISKSVQKIRVKWREGIAAVLAAGIVVSAGVYTEISKDKPRHPVGVATEDSSLDQQIRETNEETQRNVQELERIAAARTQSERDNIVREFQAGAGNSEVTGPIVAYRTHEDWYYDLNGGLLYHTSGIDQIGNIQSEYDQNSEGIDNGVLTTIGSTTGTVITSISSGITYYGASTIGTVNGGCLALDGHGGFISASACSIGANVANVKSLNINGQNQTFPNGAWVTFNNDKMQVWPQYYHAEPKIAWHTVRQVNYDANGAPLGNPRIATHWYQGENAVRTPYPGANDPASPFYCHPGLLSNAPPPAALMERGTST